MRWVRIERVTWGERALWVALVLVLIAPVALQPAAEDVARAYIAAVDRGDVNAALELMGPDFIMQPLLGGSAYAGSGAHRVLEWRAALEEHWRVVAWNYDSRQREVHATVEITNDAWTLADSRPTVGLVLVVRNGHLRGENARTGSKELRRDLQPFFAWVHEERPEELALIWQDRHLVLSADAAGRLVALLNEWRAAGDGVAESPEPGQP